MSLAAFPAQSPSFQALDLDPGMSFDEWVDMGRKLGEIEKGVMWWIGDWWSYGDAKYGERAAQALDSDTFSFQTFMDAAWVSRKFETSRRREVLSWSHHREVAALPPEEADALLDMAEIGQLSVRDLRNEVRAAKYIAQPVIEAKRGEYLTLVADPPWQYDNIATRAAANNHYPTLDIDSICRLPGARQTASNAHCYLWTTNAFLPDAFKVLEAWGFEYKTTLVWVKPQMGIGNYFRSSHEFVLFGVKGKLPVKNRNQISWFQAARTKHSAKPEKFYEMVETASPGPYLELFARTLPMLGPRPGWTPWGFES